MWIVVELISVIGYAVINRSLFSKGRVQQKINSILISKDDTSTLDDDTGLRWGDFIEVIHPYFGFVADPYRNKGVSDFGFILSKDVNPIVKKSVDKLTIGIFGGSFASGIFVSAQSLLKKCLQNSSDPKEIMILHFAGGGYKQPQQLLIFTYLLSLGAEFDIVINIDGFNEVALPPSENVPNQVHPFYPRLWHARTRNLLDPVKARHLGYIEFLKDKKQKWAEFFSDYHLYYSPTLALMWEYRNRTLSRSIYDTVQKIQQNVKVSKLYARHGPQYSYGNEEQLFFDLVELWKQCSLQMKRLCDVNQSEYYHFLQPNQYVEGSKPMTEREKRQVVNDESHFKNGVVKGYPLLREAGKELQKLGVNFTDLTMIFVENEDILYSDDCCHLNKIGNDIISHRICQTIQQQFAVHN